MSEKLYKSIWKEDVKVPMCGTTALFRFSDTEYYTALSDSGILWYVFNGYPVSGGQCFLSIPAELPVEDVFNIWYDGFCQGKIRGRDESAAKLKKQILKLF